MSHQSKFPTGDVDSEDLDRWFDDAFPDRDAPSWGAPPKAGLVIFVVSLLVAFVVIAALLNRA